MKLQRLNCPNCNAMLNMELTRENEYIFCPYCGQQFHIDNEKQEYTFNKNININKNYTKRKIDETEIEKKRASTKQTKYILIFIVITYILMFVVLFGVIGIAFFKEKIDAKKAEQAGKVNIGSHYDYEEKNYKFVVAEFQAQGFENIITIDLDDAGIFKNKANSVESVSVNGNSEFTSEDYFFITDKVIVSYH